MPTVDDKAPTLQAGAISTLGIAALGAVMMAPALGIYANLGLIGAEAGRVAPAVFLLALFCTLPTAVSYALISREIPSAGSACRSEASSLTGSGFCSRTATSSTTLKRCGGR